MKTRNTNNKDVQWNLSSSLMTTGALLRVGSRQRAQKAARMVAMGILLFSVAVAVLSYNHWTPVRIVERMWTSAG